ncbi:hypothetical protein HHI36_020240 [Cryptolaemus montrouzieri]|uniref:Uncharacterized protein n=1 Tax=Cryptolaemus montrouzieri TaxID=559131 RepID=A0ABD2NAQ1_9CUCU
MDFMCLYFVISVINVNGISSVPTEGRSDDNTTSVILEELSANGKQLSDIPQGAASIKTVDLAYNHLFCLTANIFQNKSYKDVTNLDLHENRISNISFQAFRGLRRLKTSIYLSTESQIWIHLPSSRIEEWKSLT